MAELKLGKTASKLTKKHYNFIQKEPFKLNKKIIAGIVVGIAAIACLVIFGIIKPINANNEASAEYKTKKEKYDTLQAQVDSNTNLVAEYDLYNYDYLTDAYANCQYQSRYLEILEDYVFQYLKVTSYQISGYTLEIEAGNTSMSILTLLQDDLYKCDYVKYVSIKTVEGNDEYGMAKDNTKKTTTTIEITFDPEVLEEDAAAEDNLTKVNNGIIQISQPAGWTKATNLGTALSNSIRLEKDGTESTYFEVNSYSSSKECENAIASNATFSVLESAGYKKENIEYTYKITQVNKDGSTQRVSNTAPGVKYYEDTLREEVTYLRFPIDDSDTWVLITFGTKDRTKDGDITIDDADIQTMINSVRKYVKEEKESEEETTTNSETETSGSEVTEESTEEIAPPEGEYSIYEIAWQVIRGKWGNTNVRWDALQAAGYDPGQVQELVDEFCEQYGIEVNYQNKYAQTTEEDNTTEETAAETEVQS